MSNELKALVIDGKTNKVSERAFTPAEITEYAAMQQDFVEYQANQEASNLARQSALAKLAALGLTEAEIAAL
jgi:DNA-binding NarL/FixJ family response regulator